MNIINWIKSFPLVSFAYLLTALCTTFALYNLYDGSRAEFWPNVTGKVTGFVSATQGKNQNGVTAGYRGKAEYLAVDSHRIAYRYSLMEKSYTGLDIAPNNQQITAGNSITVHYNPHNHQESRLALLINWHMVLMWLGYAALFAIAGWRWHRFLIRNN